MNKMNFKAKRQNAQTVNLIKVALVTTLKKKKKTTTKDRGLSSNFDSESNAVFAVFFSNWKSFYCLMFWNVTVGNLICLLLASQVIILSVINATIRETSLVSIELVLTSSLIS